MSAMVASTASPWSGKSAKPSVDVPRGIECYERLKAKGPTGAAAIPMHSTPLTYALTERATHDQIPLIRWAWRSDASDGRVFPYVFTTPSTCWSQNTAKIRFLGQRAGGMEQLKGRKIAHVYLDNDYGRETLPILDHQAAHYGFTVQHLAVNRRGWTRRRPGYGSRWPSPTGSSCAAAAS